MEAARRLSNFSDVECACTHFRDLLEDPELGLSDVQLGKLVKELRALRCIVEALGTDIPFAELRSKLWWCLDELEELHGTSDLHIVDGDGNGLYNEEAQKYVEGHIRQVNVLITACEECGELG